MCEEPKQFCSDWRQFGHEAWNNWRRKGDQIQNKHTSSSRVFQVKKITAEQNPQVSILVKTLTKRINLKDNGAKKQWPLGGTRTWLTQFPDEHTSQAAPDTLRTPLGHLHLQVLLSSLLREAGNSGLMCCNFWAKTTWILGTSEAGGLRTLCSSAVSVHSIGSRSDAASLWGGTALRLTDTPVTEM